MKADLRIRTTAMLAALALALTGCFVSPGKFTSELVLEDAGAFSFTYDGEIFFLGLSDLAQMESAAEEFEAEQCYT
ncbi:MAG: hypothetical protein KJP27_03735, partial [Altererythrobacter sp.]|nr:hypothetical protein [Altererythrobacter sp.]